MSAVLIPDIFSSRGYEYGADEDEAGQPDRMRVTVIIDIGGDSRMDQLDCQGPTELRNEGARGDEKQGEKNLFHEIAFLHLFDGMIQHCE